MFNNSNSFLGSIPPVTKNILAINIVMMLATKALPGLLMRFGVVIDLNSILGMHYWQSSHFSPAQLVTYAFMHGGFMHLFFNMFTLFMFGGILERFWGPKRFLYYYTITAVGAAIVQQLVWTVEFYPLISAVTDAISTNSVDSLYPVQQILSKYNIVDIHGLNSESLIEIKQAFLDLPVTVGASGAIFGLLLAFGWLFPEQIIYVFFIPVKARIGVFIFGIFELSFGIANFSFDSIAHFAHLGGMLFGAILIYIWYKRK